jgi:hypothetical protein
MSRQLLQLVAFNRGLVSRLGLARADIKRVAMSAQTMVNLMPRVLGSMMLRPGTQYLQETRDNEPSRDIPFVFSISDKAGIELTDLTMRVLVDDEIITRPAVTTAVANGDFTTNLTSWTDADEAGATSAWETGGYMGLTGNGTANAIRRQQVTVAGANIGVEHALRIVIERGPVVLLVGSTSGGDEYISQTSLAEGAHSLAFTPTGDFYIQFQSPLERITLVDSCNVEAAGDMELPTPWVEADLGLVRADQSGDVMYVACEGYQQRQIERRGTRSWSVVLYLADDGPFRVENIGPITLTASGISGNITITASGRLFTSTLVGAIFSITSVGQTVTRSITAQNTFTDEIRITGVDSSRIFTIIISGLTGTGSTVTLQRSLDEPGNWEDVPTLSWTADTTQTYDDGLDNQIVYYRIGVKTGDYAGGTIVASLQIGTGSITGVVRITAYSSPTSVSAEVLDSLGGTTATDIWAEGTWSDYRGWPSAVSLYEGRLWWVGKDKAIGSISDAFTSFDPEFEGDAGTIQRSIGSGPVDQFNWALPLQRLILGGQGAEFSCRSTSFDEPLTPSNFNLKRASSQGSAPVQAVAVDSRGMYVQRGGTRVFELAFDGETYDYSSSDLTAIVPDIGEPRIVRMAVQRQPDTRIHCVRSDGTAAVLVYDKVENVTCWIEIESDGASGEIEDVMVLPGDSGVNEDQVYYTVKRTIDGATKRYRERWAMENECWGNEALCKLADSFVVYEGAPTYTITGLDHLEGEQVVVWADGADIGTDDDDTLIYTVSGGQITITGEAVENAVIGLYYRARFRSAKLLQAVNDMGVALTQEKTIDSLGLVMANTHNQGIKYGQDFDNLSNMPGMEDGAPVPANTVWEDYDKEMFTLDGTWDTDARLCLQMAAPRPCTVMAGIIGVTTS